MVCEDFVNYKVHLYVGPVLALPDFVPVLERLIFQTKVLIGIFPVLERLFFGETGQKYV